MARFCEGGDERLQVTTTADFQPVGIQWWERVSRKACVFAMNPFSSLRGDW